jgi:sulfite reductase (ferredoxin)
MSTNRNSIAGSQETVRTEVADFSDTIERFKAGHVPEAVFVEHRLRHGVYGQRQDGVHMMRSKLPLGLIGPVQLEAFADLTEAYSQGIAHLTTRQDIQVHFISLEETPDLMRVLAAAEMTSREACGNVVRNITASVMAGVEPNEAFDVTPHGMALAQYLLRIPDGQSLGRKFKITLAGSDDPRWNLSAIHDVGAVARVQDGQRGFTVWVGGGLGAVPHPAQLFADFIPETELLPLTLAMLRVFARFGEKQKRARARMKFLVADWGIERFRQIVHDERAGLAPDPRWTAHLADERWTDTPLHPPGEVRPTPTDKAEDIYLQTNVLPQRQAGYAAVNVRVPRGDLNPTQLRGLATLLRTHAGDTMRIGADQSLLIRWVPLDRLLDVRRELVALGLGAPGAGGLGDTVTCPGADTCKLGITSPRSVARQIEPLLDRLAVHPRLRHLRIHVSGCPNSCAQHHIADIGLFGAARTVEGVTSPHYLVLLGGLAGGQAPEGASHGFGTTVAKIPAGRVGDAIERLTSLYLEQAQPDEAFGGFARRIGRGPLKTLLSELRELPSPAQAPELYVEFGKEQQSFEVRRGIGECAGSVVDLADLLMVEADGAAEDAVDRLEAGERTEPTAASAWRAMETAARALLSTEGLNDARAFDTVAEFKRRFYDQGRIYEGVGHYFLAAHAENRDTIAGDRTRRLVVEAGLFVEEAHAMLARLRAQSQPTADRWSAK